MMMNLNLYSRLLLVLVAAFALSLTSACTAKKLAKTALVEGTWEFLISTPRGDRTPTVVIDGANSTYEGEPIEVTVDGPKVQFLASQKAGSLGRMSFTFEGLVEGDTMAGTYTLETGSLKGRSGQFTAKRISKKTTGKR